MSLKENINFVKKEITSEEKFLESFVRVENFFKKYKKIILAGLGIAIIAIIAVNANTYVEDEAKIEANIAFNKVLLNSNDKDSLNILKDKSETLYNLAIYINNSKENKSIDTNIKYLKELNVYKKALEEKNINSLNDVSMENDFLFKEFAIFNKALLLAQENKFKEAKEALKLIKSDSKVNELKNLLNHYLLSK